MILSNYFPVDGMVERSYTEHGAVVLNGNPIIWIDSAMSIDKERRAG